MNEHFGPDDTDRLLSGGIHPDDAPPEMADVAAQLHRARAGASDAELTGRVGAIRTMVSGPAPAGRAHRVPAALAGKAALLAALLFGGVAAAGVMAAGEGDPVAVEESTTTTEMTTTTAEATTTTVEETTTTVEETTEPETLVVPAPEASDDQGEGPDPTGPAGKGLCTAFAARLESPGESVAYRNLAVAAMTAGQTIEEFCEERLDEHAERRAAGAQDDEAEGAEEPEGSGRPDHAGPPEGAGKPDGAGKP